MARVKRRYKTSGDEVDIVLFKKGIKLAEHIEKKLGEDLPKRSTKVKSLDLCWDDAHEDMQGVMNVEFFILSVGAYTAELTWNFQKEGTERAMTVTIDNPPLSIADNRLVDYDKVSTPGLIVSMIKRIIDLLLKSI